MPHSTRLAGDPSIDSCGIWQTVDRTYWTHRAGKPKSISPRGTLARSEALLPCWHAARQDHPPNVRLLSGSHMATGTQSIGPIASIGGAGWGSGCLAGPDFCEHATTR